MIINYVTRNGNNYLELPVDETTKDKFIRYHQICGTCASYRIERTALEVELIDLLKNNPTLFSKFEGDSVVGLPTITIQDWS